MKAVLLDMDLHAELGAFNLNVKAQLTHGVTVLFGPSGSGKSSLTKALGGLLPQARGRIAFQGRPLLDTQRRFHLSAHHRKIGFVFQEPRLFPHMTVRGNLLTGAKRHNDLCTIAQLLHLEPLLNRRPSALSGGEAARVALGRALLSEPDLLILDEPLAALDVKLKQEIIPYLIRLRDELDIPMIYVTHDLDEVIGLAQNLILMSNGAVAGQGGFQEMLNDPNMARLIGLRHTGSILRGTVAGLEDGLTKIATSAGIVWVPDLRADFGRSVDLRIMAQDVIVATSKPQNVSALNLLAGVITQISPGAGPGVVLRLSVGDQNLLARATKRSVRLLDLKVGDPVYAMIKAIAAAPQSVRSL